MFKLLLRAFVTTLGLIGPAMAQERILISSDWGKVNAELVDNNATRSLVQMLPLTIEMRDHLRQEKTGNLLRRCPTASDSSISRPVHWDCGAPITSSSTIVPAVSRSQGSSFSAAPAVTFLFLTGRVHSPCE